MVGSGLALKAFGSAPEMRTTWLPVDQLGLGTAPSTAVTVEVIPSALTAAWSEFTG